MDIDKEIKQGFVRVMMMFKVYDRFSFYSCLINITNVRKNIVVHIKIITLSLPAFLNTEMVPTENCVPQSILEI